MAMEAKKSQDLPHASWRPRKASDIIQSETQGLRTRGWWYKSRSKSRSELEILKTRNTNIQGEEKIDVSDQTKREWIHPSLSVLFGLSGFMMKPVSSGEGHLFYSVYQIKCWSVLETPSQTYPEIVFHQLSEQLLCSVVLTRKINHHRAKNLKEIKHQGLGLCFWLSVVKCKLPLEGACTLP